ncbi:hypothetical protein [Nonomuraea solani]|nr:hypothetical protein [Nonomuraea solani]
MFTDVRSATADGGYPSYNLLTVPRFLSLGQYEEVGALQDSGSTSPPPASSPWSGSASPDQHLGIN